MAPNSLPKRSNSPERSPSPPAREDLQARWEASMIQQLDRLREQLSDATPAALASNTGGMLHTSEIHLSYWGVEYRIALPDLSITRLADGAACSLFDSAMLLYYLHTADGAPLEDRWVSFRELPGGAFYYQAFQGYTGDRLAKALDANPTRLFNAAARLNGSRLTALGEYACAFQPLARVPLAVIFWAGDEEFPSRCSILFDAAACHYLTLDGLAILGARLTGKLTSGLQV